ncbi:hypothetical protein MLD38_022858 [Melastoma candidum]|uniref:Uncharacterized protein n=1 Tax=Melastoma candidum TaxID=119954 RepID=A0ACB9QKU7_9MYRT|nr:hypothetical protein MLD38_022858 [Melastoma candidum]
MEEDSSSTDAKDKTNGGVYVELPEPDRREDRPHHHLLLHSLLYRMLATVLFPDFTSPAAGKPLTKRIKISLSDNLPHLRVASRNSAHCLLCWTRRGSPLRALLVISVGTVAALTLTGIILFMLFFLAATVNVIVISLLMSLAAAGGFLAIFLACVAAIYVGALGVAIFVISTATCASVITVLVVTGWVGFLWTVWLATKKSLDLAKRSLSVTGEALSVYSSNWQSRRHPGPFKMSLD